MSQERSMEEGIPPNAREEENGSSSSDNDSALRISVTFVQKIIAEIIGTYFIVFAGCASVMVNKSTNGTVTFPGICVVWGLSVTVMIYSLGHISGAHFNPAVTISFASSRRFHWKQVPAYIAAQLIGSTLASSTLRLLFGGGQEFFAGTIPTGSNIQSLVLEFIISFYLMFVICGVATDDRAIGELAGIAIGATILLNVGFAGAISGASMNPARSLGPAIIMNRYESIWVYMIGPTCGMIVGAWVYNLVRSVENSAHQPSKSGSFLRRFNNNGSK